MTETLTFCELGQNCDKLFYKTQFVLVSDKFFKITNRYF